MGTLLNAGEPEFRVVYSEVTLTHRTFQTKNEAVQFARGVMDEVIEDHDLAVRTVFNGRSGLGSTILAGCGQRRVRLDSDE